jgi:hypothetical protein
MAGAYGVCSAVSNVSETELCVQLGVDVALMTLILYRTGGATNPFRVVVSRALNDCRGYVANEIYLVVGADHAISL